MRKLLLALLAATALGSGLVAPASAAIEPTNCRVRPHHKSYWGDGVYYTGTMQCDRAVPYIAAQAHVVECANDLCAGVYRRHSSGWNTTTYDADLSTVQRKYVPPYGGIKLRIYVEVTIDVGAGFSMNAIEGACEKDEVNGHLYHCWVLSVVFTYGTQPTLTTPVEEAVNNAASGVGMPA